MGDRIGIYDHIACLLIVRICQCSNGMVPVVPIVSQRTVSHCQQNKDNETIRWPVTLMKTIG